MKKVLNLLFVLSLTFYYLGCSPSSVTKTDEGDIPEWYLDVPKDPNYHFTVASATSQDLQIAVNNASTSARREIALFIETKLSTYQKSFAKEIGNTGNDNLLQSFTDAIKVVAVQVMNGSSEEKKHIVKDTGNNSWRAYVLYKYPLGAANKALMDQLSNNKELRTKFEESKTFQEAQDEWKQYEENKK